MTKFKEQVKQTAFEMYRKSYGMDTLNRMLLTEGIIIEILGFLFRNSVIRIFGMLMIFGFLFRYFSTNKAKRFAENQKLERSAKYGKVVWENRKTHRVYVCPFCGAFTRVPKGHGKVTITCPRCKTEFERRS